MLFTISAATDATGIPPTPSVNVTLMGSSHVSGGVVAGQMNINEANIFFQAQEIPQGWYNLLIYIIE